MRAFTGLKILYGLLELPLAAIEVFLRLYLFIHFTEVVRLPPWMTGVALLVSLAGDAAFAPWLGVRSDAWFREGRGRWPWALGGTLTAGLAFIALFQIPAGAPGPAFAALTLLLLVLSAGLAAASVPYHALIADLPAGEDPLPYLGWRAAFGAVGTLAGLAIPGLFLTLKDPLAFKQSAWALTILLFLLGFAASLSRPAFRPRPGALIDPEAVAPGWRELLRRRPFPAGPPGLTAWLFAVSFLGVAVTFAASLALPYYKVTLRFEEGLTQNLLLAGAASGLLALPGWLWVYRRLGARRAFLLSALPWAGLTALLPFALGPSAGWLALVYGGVLLGAFTGSVVLWEWWLVERALAAGTGLGAVYGLWRMTSRLSRAFGTAAAGVALSWAGIQGFDPRIDDRLALIYGPGVALLLLIALWIAWGRLRD